MALYQSVSRQVMAIMAQYTPLIEPISVDEAFLDVTGSRRVFGAAEHIGRQIKQRIRDELDLTASVGIATCKFLAKLASELGKPDGFVIVPAGGELAFLRPLPVARLWGVGQATLRQLQSLGIRTIGQLADYPPEVLERKFGVSGRHLHNLSLGLDDRPVVPEQEAKSVSSERTFQTDTTDRDRLERTLLALAEDVGARLRAADLRGRTVQLKLRWEDFTTITRQRTLPEPTQSDTVIYTAARELLHAELLPGRKVRLIGVGLSGFTTPAQPSLFAAAADEGTLDRTMDVLRHRFGRDKLKRGRLLDD
jgi:nucleotidyltransferase/DNA polymerase involved in DNA repair